MYYPKVRFEIVSIKDDVNVFKDILNDKYDSFKQRFFDLYPQLTDINIDLNVFIWELWTKHKIQVQQNCLVYQEEWDKIEPQFMNILSERSNTDWFIEPKEMKAYLSYSAVRPRFLDTKSFFVPWNNPSTKVIYVVAHEITHFLYFKKFKELFPGVPRQNYDHPYNEWILSEILAPVILNDKKFAVIFDRLFSGYDCFYKSKIEDKTIMQFFEDKYEEMINKDGKLFDDYLSWAYDFVKKNPEKIDVVR